MLLEKLVLLLVPQFLFQKKSSATPEVAIDCFAFLIFGVILSMAPSFGQASMTSGTLKPSPATTEAVSTASATCSTCHHFANGHETSVSVTAFLFSVGGCQGCSIILKALDAVTDIRRPEFKTIKIKRIEAEDHWSFLDPKNVLHVRCEQEGEPYGGRVLFGKRYVDSRPNDYEIYTPVGECFPLL